MILWSKLLIIFLLKFCAHAEILIDYDGGYKNIVIGIDPELPESDVESLLSHLEVLFKNTSRALLTASERNVFFKEIVFAVPRKYKSWILKRNILTAVEYFKKPDMFVTENDIFINPYTVQHGGCGKQGLRIHIPKKFLSTNAERRELALVRQWTQYRYGVFPENGFSDDKIYPACYRIPDSDSFRVTDCTNDKAVYEFQKEKQDDSDRFPSVCTPVPVNGKNDHIESSLMTNIDFPKMSYFCDEESRPHNRNAPSKQNALCKEKSTWKVISKHPDFKIKRRNPSLVNPFFKYVTESDPRLVVAVDSSDEMAINGRMDLVRNAFSYFVLYNLQKNATVGLINMKNKEIVPRIINIQTLSDAERLIDAFPEAYGYGDICIHCTIQKVLEDLQMDVNDIIIVTATDITDTWIDNITAILKSRNVVLHVIYFKKKLKQPVLLERVVKDSGGIFFYIAEAFPPGSSISSLTILYEAFRSIYESFSWMNKNHILIDQMTFSNNCSPKCVLSFPSDHSVEHFQVLITGPDFIIGPPVLKDSIALENGVQRFVPGNDSFTYKTKIPAYMFSIENSQPRQWNLTFERKPGYNKPIVVIIRGTNKKYSGIISMQSWIAVDEKKNSENSRKRPFTVYSEIKKNNHPIQNVEVVAYIHQASSNKELSLELKDSGEGDPDITKNDGIFSRYLTDAGELGYYSITVVAEKKFSDLSSSSSSSSSIESENLQEMNCCGSTIPEHLSLKSGYFKRITTYQSFFITSENAGINYPPRRVVDLIVEKIEILSNNIKCYVLKWTAPGDNCDKGRAFSYDIRVFNTREDAMNDFVNNYVLIIQMLNIQGPLLEPEEAGTKQTAYVELKNLTSGTYFIALRTTNHLGKTSDTSNIIEIYNALNPLFTDSGSSKETLYTFPYDQTTETTTGNENPVALSSNFGLAIGLSCGILLLLIIIGFILFVCFERHRKSKNANSNLNQTAKKTESNDALCNGNGTGNISIISPVNSWGADSLISHYETLQRKKTDINGQPSIAPESKASDSISITSSKYSYDNKIDQNSSLYDPIYFHQVQSQDEINYPYNPSYTPFNPTYTSSLRRFDNNILGNPYSSDNASLYSYNTNRNYSSRLKTDV